MIFALLSEYKDILDFPSPNTFFQKMICIWKMFACQYRKQHITSELWGFAYKGKKDASAVVKVSKVKSFPYKTAQTLPGTTI